MSYHKFIPGDLVFNNKHLIDIYIAVYGNKYRTSGALDHETANAVYFFKSHKIDTFTHMNTVESSYEWFCNRFSNGGGNVK